VRGQAAHTHTEDETHANAPSGKVVNEDLELGHHPDKHRRLGEGAIALQGHDPKSLVSFRKLRI